MRPDFVFSDFLHNFAETIKYCTTTIRTENKHSKQYDRAEIVDNIIF